MAQSQGNFAKLASAMAAKPGNLNVQKGVQVRRGRNAPSPFSHGLTPWGGRDARVARPRITPWGPGYGSGQGRPRV